MRYAKALVVAVFAACTLTAQSQTLQKGGISATEVGAAQPARSDNGVRIRLGQGTTGAIPQFLAPFALGNSNIFQSADGNIGIGTTSPVSTLQIDNSSDSQSSSGLQPYAIYGRLTSSTLNFSAAIRGDALGTSGGVAGVIGTTASNSGYGVNGVSLHPDGAGYGVVGSLAATSGSGGGGGILGVTGMTTGFSSAVRGDAYGTTGGSVAVYGEQFSPQATAGLFINRANGPILIGSAGNPDVTVFRVDGSGTVFANGGFQPNGADFAESMAVAGRSEQYVAGDLMVIDESGKRQLALAHMPYSTLVAGVYSTKPGMLGSTRDIDEHGMKTEIPLAVVGIVPCKVSAENGAIRVGDLLVTSSTLGHAMKGTDRNQMLGAVVGKALEPLNQGTGVIQVLVTLQ